MNEIAEFPGRAANTMVASSPFVALEPGETDDELLDLVGHEAHDALQSSAIRVEKAEEITDGGQTRCDAQVDAAAIGDACERLQELQVRRRFWIKTINRQDNALGALARRAIGWRYDMPEREREKANARAASLVAALLKGKAVKPEDAGAAAAIMADVAAAQEAREPMLRQRAEIEREMKRVVRALHVAGWQASVKGFGEMGLAVIVGEAGDLSSYPNPAKLWRRLGLAPYQGHAGKTWRIEKWRPRALTAGEWSDYGYSAQRLAQVYGVVSEPLMKACGGTTYRAVYDHAKATFAERAASPAHAHAHAMRVMTKALVLDLWRVWHGMPPRERNLEEVGGLRT